MVNLCESLALAFCQAALTGVLNLLEVAVAVFASVGLVKVRKWLIMKRACLEVLQDFKAKGLVVIGTRFVLQR